MQEDQKYEPIQEETGPENPLALSDSLPEEPRRRSRWKLPGLFLLLAWIACLLLAFVAFTPLVGSSSDGIPVTGGSLVNVPSAATLTPLPPEQQPKLMPGETYKFVAEQRLSTCSSSFQSLFVLERLVAHQPNLMQDPTWSSDASRAMKAFRQDCEQLGHLPAAPAEFAKVDGLLKQAAGEVRPAADGFSIVLQSHELNQLTLSINHLQKFVEYIHQVENMLQNMQDIRQL